MSFWNLDSGSRLTHCKPLQTVSCMEVAKAKNSDVLVVTDFSGTIAMLNLSLFRLNPLQISIEMTFSGYHDPEEPAVLSMAFHERSGVLLSGGDDRTIRYWRLPKDVEYQTAEQAHTGSICCMSCTEHAVVTGDEEGMVCVWSLLQEPTQHTGADGETHQAPQPTYTHTHTGQGSSSASPSASPLRAQSSSGGQRRFSTLPQMLLVAKWTLGSYAAIRSLSAHEVTAGLYIARQPTE